jgi:hypothetical protein
VAGEHARQTGCGGEVHVLSVTPKALPVTAHFTPVDNSVNKDRLLEMFGVSGTLTPETPNIYLTLVRIAPGAVARGGAVLGGAVGTAKFWGRLRAGGCPAWGAADEGTGGAALRAVTSGLACAGPGLGPGGRCRGW